MMQNENLELTFDELAKLDKEEYILLDMRDESNIAYGMVLWDAPKFLKKSKN